MLGTHHIAERDRPAGRGAGATPAAAAAPRRGRSVGSTRTSFSVFHSPQPRALPRPGEGLVPARVADESMSSPSPSAFDPCNPPGRHRAPGLATVNQPAKASAAAVRLATSQESASSRDELRRGAPPAAVKPPAARHRREDEAGDRDRPSRAGERRARGAVPSQRARHIDESRAGARRRARPRRDISRRPRADGAHRQGALRDRRLGGVR